MHVPTCTWWHHQCITWFIHLCMKGCSASLLPTKATPKTLRGLTDFHSPRVAPLPASPPPPGRKAAQQLNTGCCSCDTEGAAYLSMAHRCAVLRLSFCLTVIAATAPCTATAQQQRYCCSAASAAPGLNLCDCGQYLSNFTKFDFNCFDHCVLLYCLQSDQGGWQRLAGRYDGGVTRA